MHLVKISSIKHLLLENAFTYNRRKEIESPVGFIYNKITGAWIAEQDGTLLINHPDYPRPGSKKCDVETGEDQKGQ